MASAKQPARYDLLAISLHWVTLLLLVFIYLTIEVYEFLSPDSMFRNALGDWHGYLGLVLLPIAVIRLLHTRRKVAPPVTPPLSAWQSTLTRWMKNYLYVLIIGMPLSGWIFLSADGAMISLWAFPVPPIAPENQGLAQLAERVHALLGVSGYLLLPVHAIAALFHHYVMRDDTLIRMLPLLKSRKR